MNVIFKKSESCVFIFAIRSVQNLLESVMPKIQCVYVCVPFMYSVSEPLRVSVHELVGLCKAELDRVITTAKRVVQ